LIVLKAVLKLHAGFFFCLFICAVCIAPIRTAAAAPVRKADIHAKKAHKDSEPSVYYFVKKGDTLTRIARDHGVSVASLKNTNNIPSGDIFTGMKLRIPSSESAPCSSNVSYDNDDSAPVKNGFDWPVKPVLSVSTDGDKGVKPIGIIIRSKNGNKVSSSESGSVEKIGRMRGYGNFVVIKHTGGIVSVYSGLDAISVKEGTVIKKGCPIGRLETGTSELHFMIHRGGKPEDPLKLLPSRKS
jgi:murein DD-endopeptidase MepM/ murein hydrolase activator NlpD